MAIAFRCGECKKRLKVKDEHAGRRIKCPECSARVEVPAASAEEPGDEPEDEPAPAPKRTRGDTARRARPAAATPARKARDEEEEGDGEQGDDDDDGDGDDARPKAKGRGGLLKKKKAGSARRSRPAPASGGGVGGFLSGVGLRVVGTIAAILVIVALNFFTGSQAYDRGFAQVQVGSTREQVVALMGKPDVAQTEGTEELLAYEAIDKTGRRSTKHTYYFVILEGGKVIEKERLNEAEFDARFGRQ